MTQTEHDDQVDGRDHHDEPEHRENLDQATAGVGAYPLAFPGQQAQRDEDCRRRGHRAERSRPADQKVEHRRHQCDRGRKSHPDPEPLHPLPVVPDRPDVTGSHRCDRQRYSNRPADRAVGQAEGPLVDDEHEANGDGHHVAAHRHEPTHGVVKPSVGQSEEEVERDSRDDDGGQRRRVPGAARRMHRL